MPDRAALKALANAATAADLEATRHPTADNIAASVAADDQLAAAARTAIPELCDQLDAAQQALRAVTEAWTADAGLHLNDAETLHAAVVYAHRVLGRIRDNQETT